MTPTRAITWPPGLYMTLLITSIPVRDAAQAARNVAEALPAGAEAIELRIDAYAGEAAALSALILRHPRCKWIVTCRTRAEGGAFAGDAASALQRAADVARNTPAWIDLDQRSCGPAAAFEAAAPGAWRPAGVIVSSHAFDGRTPDVEALRAAAGRLGPGAPVKIVWTPRDVCDNFAAFQAQREGDGHVSAICMGEEGLASRILARKFGAFASYCCLGPDAATAAGQPALADVKSLYRWDAIGPRTRVFGLAGDPVAHSAGPAFFNAAFGRLGMDAVYVPFRVRGREALARFLAGAKARPWLDFGGLSVTLPHKRAAFELADAIADEETQRIGAVNTLTLRGGRWIGANTDAPAAAASLAAALGCEPADLAGLAVDLLGTGGAARAVAAGLRKWQCTVTVFGRDPARTAAFAGELDCAAADWAERAAASGARRAGDILVNATSVGLAPQADASPMPPQGLAGRRLVFDLVYQPAVTRLLADAAAAGCQILGGRDMFARQASMQLEIWTGVADSSGF